MKNLNKNQRIGVIAGIVTLFVLFFSSPLMNLFNLGPSNNTQEQMTSGIKTQEIVVGEGATAEAGDLLTVHYIGSLQNGQVFDSSRDTNVPFEFTLGVGQVIKGWDEGLAGMHVGGKRTVVVPPEYGYGDQAIGAIPPNSTLIFEVELLDVKKSPTAPVESL